MILGESQAWCGRPHWHSFSGFFPYLKFFVTVLTSGRGGRKWPNIGLSGWVGREGVRVGGWGGRGAVLKIKTLFSPQSCCSSPPLSLQQFFEVPASPHLYPIRKDPCSWKHLYEFFGEVYKRCICINFIMLNVFFLRGRWWGLKMEKHENWMLIKMKKKKQSSLWIAFIPWAILMEPLL